MTDPSEPVDRRVERRCQVLLRLAVVEGERGHRVEARDLLAAAECEARRGDRPDLLLEVRRACLRAEGGRQVTADLSGSRTLVT